MCISERDVHETIEKEKRSGSWRGMINLEIGSVQIFKFTFIFRSFIVFIIVNAVIFVFHNVFMLQ